MKKIVLILLFFTFFVAVNAQNREYISIRAAIEYQIEKYPKLRLQDIYKNFYQDFFGPEHLIADTASVRRYLLHELSEMSDSKNITQDFYFEYIGNHGNFVRVYLSAVQDGLITINDLSDAFVRSAAENFETDETWESKWNSIVEIIENNNIKITKFQKDKQFLCEAAGNNEAVRHSNKYRKFYHPHYRIVTREIFENEFMSRLEREQ